MIRPLARTLGLVAALAAVAALAGCGGAKMSDLRDWVARVEARPGAPLPPPPKPQTFQGFVWHDGSMRSPFVPASSGGKGGVRPNPNRPKEYLEQFPLDGLKLVGEVAASGQEYALILDPNGLVTRVTVGSYLGQNNGRIVAITPTGIEISEIVPNGTGGYVRRPASLSLSQQSGG